jgi:hypothetical protein
LGRDEATRKAAELLEKRGVIQANYLTNVYRLPQAQVMLTMYWPK